MEIAKWFDQPVDPVAETEWTAALDRVAELLKRDFGLRCDAYSPSCCNCIKLSPMKIGGNARRRKGAYK